MTNAQEWLESQEEYNTKDKREEVKELNISNKNLEGELDLTNFISLELLDCSENYSLTSLVITNSSQLTKLKCNECQLNKLVIGDCRKLAEVDYSYNNSLVSSCEIFQNLDQLKTLDVRHTKINNGLEYLPESLERFFCTGQLAEELDDYEGGIIGWREFYGQSQKWIDENYPKEIRGEITELNVGSKGLERGLRLPGFINLKILNCSGNDKLTKLDLSDCQKLELLDVSNCPSLGGSLKFLKHLNNLEELNITNTNFSEGLEYLPDSCKRIIYDHNSSNHGSKVLIKELYESGCLVEENNKRYYDFVKFAQRREKKQNGMIASIIPLERLFVVRGNMRQFLKKWGIRKGNESIELSKLQSPSNPDELWKHRWIIYSTQLLGRGAAVAGAILTFQDQGAIGGGILGIYPLAELVASKLEEKLKNKEIRWKEFLTDTDNLSDNFNELSGILSQFKISELKGGKVNEMIKNLNKNITEFLKIYDENGDKEIDVEEIKNKRDELTKDLNNKENKLQAVMDSIKELENAVIEYRQISYYGMSETKTKKEINTENSQEIQNSTTINQVKTNKQDHQAIDVIEEVMEVPPKW